MGKHPASRPVEFSKPSAAEEELRFLIRETRHKLLCNIVINKTIRFVNRISPLKLKEDSFVAVAAATILLSILFYLLATSISYVQDQSIPLLNPVSALVSVLAAFSFSIVKGLHDNILPEDKDSDPTDTSKNPGAVNNDPTNNFAKNLITVAPAESLVAMRNWWESFLSLPYQCMFVATCGLLSIITVWIFGRTTSIHFHAGSFSLMFVCGIALGQGGYCALRIPKLAKAITIAPRDMFWLYPAESLWVKETSSVFTKLSLANALIATCCIIGLMWPRPWKSSMPAIVASIWLIITLTVVLYSFIYPHYHLGKAIKTTKKREISRMQALIDFSKDSLKQSEGDGEIKKLNELVKVYDQMANSRDSAIDMQATLRLFFSLAIPILSFIGILVQVGSIIANYLGVQRNP